MRTMKVLAVLALVALSAQLAFASDIPLGVSDDALLFSEAGGQPASAHLASVQAQRSLLQYGTPPPPYYCANSHIKPVFTAKIAVLLVNNKYKGVVKSGDYVDLISTRLNKRFKRYNKRYKLSLGYTISQINTGSIQPGNQKWFYYEIKFIVGSCGKYKFPLITQLRGEIQPSAGFIKRNRLVSYPFK